MTIPTRDEFTDLLSGMTDLSDYDDAIAAYDAQAARIAELEGSADLFDRCYVRARAIWRKRHPERSQDFDPDGAEAIASMIADHDEWEKHSLTRMVERIAALEAVCDSAMDALANGDLVGVHRHLLPVWSRDRG